MAHSAWMIPNPSEKTTPGKQSQGRRAQKSPSRAQTSFAALMAREQNIAARADAPVAASSQAEPAPNDTGKKTGGTETGASDAMARRQSQAKTRSQPMVARLPDAGMVLQNAALAGRSPNDLLRIQNFNKAAVDLQRTRAINDFFAGSGSTSLDIARGMGAARSLRTIAAAGNGKGFALTANDFIHTARHSGAAATGRTSRVRKSRKIEESGIGKLSARFESGQEGIAAIGYDRAGGTSYGKYQIASRVGSMNGFLSFLDEEAPDLSRRLRRAGPANTGSRSGAMPNEWRAIAREQPERFEQLQEAFIRESHYKPALDAITARTGIDTSSLSAAMREVIWSTAVQHGPAGAARIFARADDMSGKKGDAGYERKLIDNVYTVRAGQFGSSTNRIRNAVRNRFRQERQLALNMLEGANRADMA